MPLKTTTIVTCFLEFVYDKVVVRPKIDVDVLAHHLFTVNCHCEGLWSSLRADLSIATTSLTQVSKH